MYKLRDYQQQAVDSVWRFLCNRKGNPVVVLPTGAGKSLVIAELARQAAGNGLGVLVVAHRKELLEQNAEKIRSLLPGISVGIYSAGLKSRDTEDQVILAGIQSVYKRAFEFGARHLVIVDEAHLIPDTDAGIYRQFLDDLRVSCPQHRVVGLTATPYRLDSGLIYGGGGSMFDDVAIEVAVGDLIDQGYLSPITSQPVTEIDTSSLHHRGGEFVKGEMESLFERSVIDACRETVEIANGTGRKSVIVFACGVQHASHVREIIESFGESVACVTGETLPLVREGTLADFKAGRVRFLVNVDVLTTGFDAPNIDCIAVMRATESAGLFAQIVGRGLRLSPGKSECVVLDFGENIKRHGPIDSKDYGKLSKKKGTGGDGPVKACPACDELVPAGVRECGCGFRFPPPEIRHDSEADKESAILQAQQKPQSWIVEGIKYSLHVKRDTSQRSMRVTYDCLPDSPDAGELERQSISEWICLEHAGFAQRMAERWWHARAIGLIPNDVEDALEIARSGGLADTRAIKTKKDGKYFRIVDYTLGEIPDEVFEPIEEFEEEELPF